MTEYVSWESLLAVSGEYSGGQVPLVYMRVSGSVTVQTLTGMDGLEAGTGEHR